LITDPGFYPEMTAEQYHSDPVDGISLSRSGIRTILEETPAHFKARHPKLTPWPEYLREGTEEQDLGTVVHRLVLGKGGEFEVFGFDDWRKKEAQMLRDAARAAGHVPMLRHKMIEAQEIADRAIDALVDRFGDWPIGESEVGMIWQRLSSDDVPVWCRAYIDHLISSQGLLIDIKTTSKSLSDSELAKKIAANGDDLQAAFYRSGFEKLVPEFVGRSKFLFVLVETAPPFAVRFAELPNRWLNMASLRIDRAVDIFAECLDSGVWPAWQSEATLDMPGWRESQWMGAELAEGV
jgi:hypothetical protein